MTKRSIVLSLTLTICSAVSMHAAVIPTDGVELLIPIAGYAPGANGEFFSTDVTLVSLSRADQRVQMTWLPAAGTGTPITRTVNMKALTVQPLVSVVRQVFGAEGIGAILINAADPTSANVPAIDAQARIWTESIHNSRAGTVSHNVPAIRLEGWRSESAAMVHGVRQNANFRTNYGIVNFDSYPQYFLVMVNSPGGRFEERVSVPPMSLLHRRVPGSPDGELSVYIQPIADTSLNPISRPYGPWRAYASTTDNMSGSSWTVVAIQPRTDLQF